MSTKLKNKRIATNNDMTQEYSMTLDGVIELSTMIREKKFFDGLLDIVIAYVEKHHGLAGLSMSHKPYELTHDETDNNEVNRGRQDSQNGQRVRSIGKKIRQSSKRTRR